jgi:hypothetical protein
LSAAMLSAAGCTSKAMRFRHDSCPALQPSRADPFTILERLRLPALRCASPARPSAAPGTRTCRRLAGTCCCTRSRGRESTPPRTPAVTDETKWRPPRDSICVRTACDCSCARARARARSCSSVCLCKCVASMRTHACMCVFECVCMCVHVCVLACGRVSVRACVSVSE